MKPTSITLEIVNGTIQLKVYAKETLKGFTIIESVKFNNGKSLEGLRKVGTKYAKRFDISFTDKTK